jgi:hypothetical protein
MDNVIILEGHKWFLGREASSVDKDRASGLLRRDQPAGKPGDATAAAFIKRWEGK